MFYFWTQFVIHARNANGDAAAMVLERVDAMSFSVRRFVPRRTRWIINLSSLKTPEMQ